MRFIYIILFLSCLSAKAQQHCGYDFSSYLVLHIHEDGKPENIANLKVTLIDFFGNELVNAGNKYSWTHRDEVMTFYENYKIDANGNKVSETPNEEKTRWFFPFAKATYLISVTNDFPIEGIRAKIEDVSEKQVYQTQIINLFAFNMYVLCTTQAEKAQQFGARVNKPVNVVLKRRE
ncbi:hypothetical protein [Flavobacterium sp. SM2513]|uniref:hypothetical protein n=1 Tax=Flavobacterium sp. SM2513 TaxID=3424766 RepID=UPI003D7F7EAF